MRSLNPARIAIAVLAVVGSIATFLPWATVPILGPITGTDYSGPGWVTLGLFVIGGALALSTGPRKPLTRSMAIASGAPSIVACGWAVYKMLDLQSSTRSMSDSPLVQAIADNASIGYGLYVVLAAAAGTVAIAAVAAIRARART